MARHATSDSDTNDEAGQSSMRSDQRKESIRSLMDEEKDRFDLPHDSWGAGIVVFVKDLGDILNFKAYTFQVLRCAFCMGCLILNLYMQIQILMWVWVFVIGVSVRSVQDHYRSYHGQVFDEDTSDFLDENWPKFPFKREICQAAITQLMFLSAVLFFWTARMIVELRGCERLFRSCWQVPRLPSDASADDMVQEPESLSEEEELHLIIALNKSTRFFIFILIIIPKFVIGVALLLLGCRWLTSTESFEDLILNALALEFIVGIDELIFECFCPARMAKFIDQTKVAIPHKHRSEDEQHREIVKDYLRSMSCMAGCFLWVYLYLNYIQQVLPGYDGDINHCDEFIKDEFVPTCRPFSGFGGDCFPYGPAS